MTRTWAQAGIEPEVGDFLNDEVIQAVLERDGLTDADFHHHVDLARRLLGGRAQQDCAVDSPCCKAA
jgi:hypothetical protein